MRKIIARAFSVATAALALGVEHRWLDNLLSRHTLAGVSRAGRGVARRVQPETLVTVAVALELLHGLEIPLDRALTLGATIRESPDRPVRLGCVTVAVDLAAIERALTSRLHDALETAPRRRRGRPPHSP